MTAIAVGGLIANIIAAWLLHSDHEHDLNIRGAWLHVMGDMLGSVAAIMRGPVDRRFRMAVGRPADERVDQP